jgi:hypothetical protein
MLYIPSVSLFRFFAICCKLRTQEHLLGAILISNICTYLRPVVSCYVNVSNSIVFLVPANMESIEEMITWISSTTMYSNLDFRITSNSKQLNYGLSEIMTRILLQTDPTMPAKIQACANQYPSIKRSIDHCKNQSRQLHLPQAQISATLTITDLYFLYIYTALNLLLVWVVEL